MADPATLDSLFLYIEDGENLKDAKGCTIADLRDLIDSDTFVTFRNNGDGTWTAVNADGTDGPTFASGPHETDTFAVLSARTITFPDGTSITVPNGSTYNSTTNELTTSDGQTIDLSSFDTDTDTFATFNGIDTITFADGQTLLLEDTFVTFGPANGDGTVPVFDADGNLVGNFALGPHTVDTDTFSTYDPLTRTITFVDGSTTVIPDTTPQEPVTLDAASAPLTLGLSEGIVNKPLSSATTFADVSGADSGLAASYRSLTQLFSNAAVEGATAGVMNADGTVGGRSQYTPNMTIAFEQSNGATWAATLVDGGAAVQLPDGYVDQYVNVLFFGPGGAEQEILGLAGVKRLADGSIGFAGATVPYYARPGDAIQIHWTGGNWRIGPSTYIP